MEKISKFCSMYIGGWLCLERRNFGHTCTRILLSLQNVFHKCTCYVISCKSDIRTSASLNVTVKRRTRAEELHAHMARRVDDFLPPRWTVEDVSLDQSIYGRHNPPRSNVLRVRGRRWYYFFLHSVCLIESRGLRLGKENPK